MASHARPNGRPSPSEVPLPPAITQLIDGFQLYLTVERRVAPATRDSYCRTLRRFFAAWQQQGREAHVDLVIPALVRQYLAERRAEGQSPRTIALMLAGLRAFDRWLAQEGRRSALLLADMQTPRPPRSLPHVLSQEEIERLLQQPSRTTPVGLRDLAMLEVLYATGMRVEELVSLPLSALHLSEGWLKIRGKGGRERIVPMGEPAMAALRVYLGEPRAALLGQGRKSPSVFISQKGRPITRQAFWALLRGYARQAGITKPLSPHTLRHSFATHLLEGGADILSVSRLLGHQTLATMEIYTHVQVEHLREAYQRFHPRA